MGTDIYPILTIRQLDNHAVEPENVEDILDSIETEFGKSFEEHNENEYGTDGIRWSCMTEDMEEFSKKHPGVLFGIQYEWPDDGSEYMEWFENGRYYCDSRPDWKPIFQEAKFLKDSNAPSLNA